MNNPNTPTPNPLRVRKMPSLQLRRDIRQANVNFQLGEVWGLRDDIATPLDVAAFAKAKARLCIAEARVKRANAALRQQPMPDAYDAIAEACQWRNIARMVKIVLRVETSVVD